MLEGSSNEKIKTKNPHQGEGREGLKADYMLEERQEGGYFPAMLQVLCLK